MGIIPNIYDLKQAPQAWYNGLRQFLLSIRFVNSQANTLLFIFNKYGFIAYLLVYVDDIILTGNKVEFLVDIVTKLVVTFSIKDLGNLSYFLGVEVLSTSIGLFLL